MALYLKESNDMATTVFPAAFRHPYLHHPATFLSPPPPLPLASVRPEVRTSPAIVIEERNSTPTPTLTTTSIKYAHELPPTPPTSVDSAESVCEAAARILFNILSWMKSTPAFLRLPVSDQLSLLEEGWREMFVLGAAQFQLPIEAASLLTAAGISPDKSPSDDSIAAIAEIRVLQDTIAKFRSMQVDRSEYACLKGIVIFKTAVQNNDIKSAQDIAAIQDQAQVTLSTYINKAYPSQPLRFGQLLLLLPSLKSVSSATIERLFFKKAIRDVPIDKLLVDMYKSNDYINEIPLS
ncbi:DgyrCDS8789 [Dimorphilus gyrociliatus]|nr:DgyrCDS8789 [Dimorphilus gyrociliatus]